MSGVLKLLCGFKNRPTWLIALALALLLLLLLLREWLWGLFLLYLGALVCLGLLGGMRLAQAILRKLCWKGRAVPKGAGSEGHPPSKGIDIPPHTYKRPDPMIYSQFYLMAKGIAVTWDNPDIQLSNGAGVAVPSHSLTPGTPYDVRARIWNGSTDAGLGAAAIAWHFISPVSWAAVAVTSSFAVAASVAAGLLAQWLGRRRYREPRSPHQIKRPPSIGDLAHPMPRESR